MYVFDKIDSFNKETGPYEFKPIKSHVYASSIDESLKTGINSGVEGTPTFFVNRVRYEESWDLKAFSDVLKKHLTT